MVTVILTGILIYNSALRKDLFEVDGILTVGNRWMRILYPDIQIFSSFDALKWLSINGLFALWEHVLEAKVSLNFI
jgi:hypothetical protein